MSDPITIEVPEGPFDVRFVRKRRYSLRVIVLIDEPVELFDKPFGNYVRTDRDPRKELWMRA